ncbi:hypothetical protein V7054_13040 [Priestia megaterium]|jgi:hypothetical protein|uniref:hypothetical protein n=1 Tax=Priestia megaterium TaxID=1404 RepID=UPI00215B5313|nr:hypothetical protein [Priestia megaterium]MCR8867431.1 hypothetical protein [Priestia megaterium]
MYYIKKASAILVTLALLLGIFSLPTSSYASTNEESNQSLEPIDPSQVTYESNKNLSDEQVSDRFEEINSKYDIEEPFSAEDAEFIRAYASSPTDSTDNDSNSEPMFQTQSIKLNSGSQAFSKSTKSYGVGVSFTGRVYGDINALNHSYRGKMTAKITSGSSKVKKIQTTVTNVAYGLLGNGGTYVGIVYNGSKSSSTTKNKTSWSMDETVKYGGVAVVYTYTNAYTRITTTTGSFNLYAF